MLSIRTVFAALFLSFNQYVIAAYNTAAPTATIDAGEVVGTTTSIQGAQTLVNKFLGVPFAKSPPERFAPPESPTPFSEPINATAWSPACIQQFMYPKAAQEQTELLFNSPPPEESEDCLYLNVYAPATPAPPDGRAVMYWIYGGSLQFGNAGQPYYDGSSFAANEDVILVTVNYRTNAESGQVSYAVPYQNSTPAWQNLSRALGCPGHYASDLACSLRFNPVADNVTLVYDPAQRRLAGKIAHIPVLGGSNAQEGRVFTIGQTNTTAFLEGYVGNDAKAIKTIEAAYPLGSQGINNTYNQIAQIFTEAFFQCPAAMWANDTAKVGIPAWRYYYNASFSNEQIYQHLGVFHRSEIPVVFGTYPRANTTTQQYALSRSMQGAWARFAKNLDPGWNPVGTGAVGEVLVGAYGEQAGGVFMRANASIVAGGYDLGVWGNRGDVMGSGITLIDQYEVDYRCGLFKALYSPHVEV